MCWLRVLLYKSCQILSFLCVCCCRSWQQSRVQQVPSSTGPSRWGRRWKPGKWSWPGGSLMCLSQAWSILKCAWICYIWVKQAKPPPLYLPECFLGLNSCKRITSLFSSQVWKTHKLLLQHHLLATLVYWWVAAAFKLVFRVLFFYSLVQFYCWRGGL